MESAIRRRAVTPSLLWSFTPVLLSVSEIMGAEEVEERNVAFCGIVCGLET